MRTVLTDQESLNLTFDIPAFSPGAKPFSRKGGLWYSFDNAWRQLASSRLPDMIRQHEFAIELDHSRMVRLDTLQQIAIFTQVYGSPDKEKIDWARVAQNFSGIEITPAAMHAYQSQDALYLGWLYPWDIAQGYVWDAKSIISAQKLALDTHRPNLRR